jgi:hypothetical protein
MAAVVVVKDNREEKDLAAHFFFQLIPYYL